MPPAKDPHSGTYKLYSRVGNTILSSLCNIGVCNNQYLSQTFSHVSDSV